MGGRDQSDKLAVTTRNIGGGVRNLEASYHMDETVA
jgi:hypothetical protein